MYSMVLMAALTAATDVPDWGRRGGGCCGCYGGYGWGGWGGGYGRGGYGWGGWGGYGWGGLGGYGGWGGYSRWGGYGGWGVYGGLGYVYAPMAPAYAAPVMVASAPLPATRSMYYNPDPSASRRATIIVHVPENATLMVDGKPTNSTSTTRRFYSPPLDSGKSYHYNFEARMDRDGQTVKTGKRVDVRAGDTRNITITLPDLNQSLEDKPSTRRPAEKKGFPERRKQVAQK